MTRPRVLVVDDDYGDSEALQGAFVREVDPTQRCEFAFCSGQADGRNSLETVLEVVGGGWPPGPGRTWWSLVLLDVAFFQRPRTEGGDTHWGFTVLEALRERWDDLPVVMLTGQKDAKNRANWTKADGFLEKPVEGATGNDHAFLTRLYSFGLFPDLRKGKRLIGSSRPHLKALQEARRFACDPLGSGRILYGETGTGKTEIARFIHDEMEALLGRKGKFHSWSAAGMNEDIARDTLFGHWEGFHSHADFPEPGEIEKAEGGTFFLDEVASLSPALQALFMESRRRRSDFRRLISRMGTYPQLSTPRGTKAYRDQLEKIARARASIVPGVDFLTDDGKIAVDVVMLTASNVNLHDAEVSEQLGFRRDLLNDLGAPVVIPGLNERREDIPEIFREIVAGITSELGRERREIDPRVTEDLQRRDWAKRNVVALRQIAEHVVIASRDFDEILLRHLPADRTPSRWAGDRPPRPSTLVEISGNRDPRTEATEAAPSSQGPRTLRELSLLLAGLEVPADRESLRGALPSLQEAYARLVLRCFGAALRATRNQRGETSSLKAVCELLGAEELKGNPQSQAAYDAVLRMVDLANVNFEGLRGLTPPVLSEDPDVVERVQQAFDQRRKSSRKNVRRRKS